MRTIEYALHHLSLEGRQVTVEPYSFDTHFDQITYSRFKYGDGEAARKYGRALLELLQYENAISQGEEFFVSSSAYYYVPTAAAAIADSLLESMEQSSYAVHYLRLHCDPYAKDYGAMDTLARSALLAENNLHLDPEIASRVQGNTVIVVDDVRITGLHEVAIQPILERAEVTTALFCYVAILNRLQGEKNPSIEDQLNHTYVKGLAEVTEIMQTADFRPNARLCKLILNANPQALHAFVASVPPEPLIEIMDCMRADRYDSLPQYIEKFSLLERLAAG